MSRKRNHYQRTYRKLRWFFEQASAEGAGALSMDPNGWLFRRRNRTVSGFSETQDLVSTIRVLLEGLWTGAPPCLTKCARRLSPGEKQHLSAEFFGGELTRKGVHPVMLTRALAKIDRVFEEAGIFEEREQTAGVLDPGDEIREQLSRDGWEYAQIRKMRENVMRE